MENLGVLSAIDPDIQEMLNVLLAFLLLPIVPTIASTLLETLGCGLDSDLMLVYWLYSVYYVFAVDFFFGAIHFWAATIGILTVGLLCLPDPGTLVAGLLSSECGLQVQEISRDLDLATIGLNDLSALTTKASTLLTACLPA
jgi:hypothetical protein